MIDLKQLFDSMPPDLQRKVSCHDLKQTVDKYNSISRTSADSQLCSTRIHLQNVLNATARDLVKKVEGRDEYMCQEGTRLKDSAEWVNFYNAARKLDAPQNAEASRPGPNTDRPCKTKL